MYVFIDRDGHLSLRERDDFTALKLVTGLPHAAVAAVLAQQAAGSLGDANHAWISQQWLRGHGPADDAHWTQQFESMLVYAARKQWLDVESGAIRVHLETSADS